MNRLTREQIEELRGQIGAEFDGAIMLTEKHMNALCNLALTALSAEPVAWMQSDHLHKLQAKHCGSQSMMARCSDRQLQSDYQPLYAAPPSLLAENKRLREALEFYADPESWKSHPVRGGGESGPVEYECPIGEDQGDIARAALREPK